MGINLKQAIGVRLKAARNFHGLSQSELAEKIDRTKETISNIERARSAPTIETLGRLSNILGVPMKEFFEGYDRSNINKKRMELEMEIRESLKELSVNELKIAKKQILALTHRDD
ncbi:MAG: helix-turn-helix transcriptional regulator [Ectothiorhodospiraceae bacterium]|nr:helix-turn-helix transcriptional regulator [Ectothiorhodospiraceae bacterium]